MYVWMDALMHGYMHGPTSVYEYVYAPVYVYICTGIFAYVCICVCVWMCMVSSWSDVPVHVDVDAPRIDPFLKEYNIMSLIWNNNIPLSYCSIYLDLNRLVSSWNHFRSFMFG